MCVCVCVCVCAARDKANPTTTAEAEAVAAQLHLPAGPAAVNWVRLYDTLAAMQARPQPAKMPAGFSQPLFDIITEQVGVSVGHTHRHTRTHTHTHGGLALASLCSTSLHSR